MSANKYLDRNQVRILVAAHFQAIKNLEISGDPKFLAKELSKEMKEIIDSFTDPTDVALFQRYYALELDLLQNSQLN